MTCWSCLVRLTLCAAQCNYAATFWPLQSIWREIPAKLQTQIGKQGLTGLLRLQNCLRLRRDTRPSLIYCCKPPCAEWASITTASLMAICMYVLFVLLVSFRPLRVDTVSTLMPSNGSSDLSTTSIIPVRKIAELTEMHQSIQSSDWGLGTNWKRDWRRFLKSLKMSMEANCWGSQTRTEHS